tara:strand:- start:373 stop:990 length:618 start_codon:yes stop_codon:yes gene_type:complete
MDYPSKLVEEAVEQFSKLPGLGKKTALRFVLNILKMNKQEVSNFGNAFINLRNNINYCSNCHSISDLEICDICKNINRDDSIICVVEDIRDVMAIEKTNQFKGKYHVLGGVISPIDAIGPSDLNISSLLNKIEKVNVKELIMALSSTMEGDTTNFYIFKKIKNKNIKMSVIARGISVGDELEYADEVTLGRSILNRTLYENTLAK